MSPGVVCQTSRPEPGSQSSCLSTRGIPVSIDDPCGPLKVLHLDLPDTRGIALACHPRPLLAGAMQDKVVTILQCSARDASLATLRFNFRSVGQSVGSYSEGIGETSDAKAAAHWLLTRHPGLSLTLMGPSLGSCIAGNLAGHLEAEGVGLARLFMIAPSVERFVVSLPTRYPLTVVQPKGDDMVTSVVVYVWNESLVRPHELLWVAKSRHFFRGKLIGLKDLSLSRLQD